MNWLIRRRLAKMSDYDLKDLARDLAYEIRTLHHHFVGRQYDREYKRLDKIRVALNIELNNRRANLLRTW